MKTLLCAIVFFLPLVAFSQVQPDTAAIRKLSSEINNLQNRIAKLEKTTNKVQIDGSEVTQDTFPKIKFDFSSPKSITIPNKIREGEFYQIEVTGINLNQYVLVMENSDTVYSTPLSFPTFGTIDLSSLTSLVESLSPKISKEGKAAVDKMAKSSSGEKTFKKGVFTTDDEVARLLAELSLRMELEKKQKDTEELITARIEKETLQVSEYLASLKATNDVIDDKKYSYMAYRVLRQTNDTSNDYRPVIKDDLREYDALRLALKALKEKIDTNVKSLKEFIDSKDIKNFLAGTKDVDLKDNLAKAEKALAEASAKTAKALELISSDNIEKQLVSVLNLYKDQTYTSLPIQYHGEQATAKIKFVPKDSASGLQPYYLSPIMFPHQRFYWSVGPSIYYTRLENQRVGTQTIQVNDSTLRYQLLKESSLEGEMGAAVLLRGGAKLWRPSGWVPSLGVHFAVGTGLSLGEEVRPRMLLGGGFTIGQKHSLAVDFGTIGGSVKVVSANADYEQLYNEKPEILINDFQFKFFWSVGYAFRL